MWQVGQTRERGCAAEFPLCGYFEFHAFGVLFDQLAGNDAEDFLDAGAVFGGDFVAHVPADVLAPESGTTLRAGGTGGAVTGGGRGGEGGCGWDGGSGGDGGGCVLVAC